MPGKTYRPTLYVGGRIFWTGHTHETQSAARAEGAAYMVKNGYKKGAQRGWDGVVRTFRMIVRAG